MRKNNFLAVFLILSLAFISCSKSSSNGGSGDAYFRFKANGTTVDYSSEVRKAYSIGRSNVDIQAAGKYSALLSASASNTDVLVNAISIMLIKDTRFETGISYEITGTGEPESFTMGYYDKNGKSFIAARSLSSIGLKGSGSVKYTSISEKYIEGEFSGVLYDNTQTEEVSITEGSFKLRRVP